MFCYLANLKIYCVSLRLWYVVTFMHSKSSIFLKMAFNHHQPLLFRFEPTGNIKRKTGKQILLSLCYTLFCCLKYCNLFNNLSPCADTTHPWFFQVAKEGPASAWFSFTCWLGCSPVVLRILQWDALRCLDLNLRAIYQIAMCPI